MATLSIPISTVLAERLRTEAERRQTSPEGVAQDVLERALLPEERPESKMSFAEAAKDFIGVFDGPGDLTTNPKYFDDFGR